MSNKYNLLVGLGFVLGLAACEKNALELPVTENPSGAYVKFIHACATCPAVDAYWGNQKLTAGSLQSLGYSPVMSFPSLGYSLLNAGQSELRFNRYTPSDSVILRNNLTLEAGKYYTVILGDTLQTPSVTALDDALINPATDTSAQIRFANFIARVPNNADLEVVRKTDSTVLSASYRKATNWLPNRISTNFDTFYVRPAGSRLPFTASGTNATPFIRYNNTNLVGRRNFTVVVSGIWGRTGTVAPRLQIISNR